MRAKVQCFSPNPKQRAAPRPRRRTCQTRAARKKHSRRPNRSWARSRLSWTSATIETLSHLEKRSDPRSRSASDSPRRSRAEATTSDRCDIVPSDSASARASPLETTTTSGRTRNHHDVAYSLDYESIKSATWSHSWLNISYEHIFIWLMANEGTLSKACFNFLNVLILSLIPKFSII